MNDSPLEEKGGKKSHEIEVQQSTLPFNFNVLYKLESPCRHH
jgi:hypothetical protein